ncbi:hypothetical protein DPMN_062996 [Dreissena polymorpha]|uniref:Uncharacterized protein n=1 Tax=Dreissena polymorpha TaxID=45954 RepID=A0A9D4CAT2_DREPO|nr:hypothetical protein DPMN_062996 [Dreissena polymorpha]
MEQAMTNKASRSIKRQSNCGKEIEDIEIQNQWTKPKKDLENVSDYKFEPALSRDTGDTNLPDTTKAPALSTIFKTSTDSGKCPRDLKDAFVSYVSKKAISI